MTGRALGIMAEKKRFQYNMLMMSAQTTLLSLIYCFLIGFIPHACGESSVLPTASEITKQEASLPMSLSIVANQSIYRPSQPLSLRVVFTARQAVTLCLTRNLHQRLNFQVRKMGKGIFSLEPYVMTTPDTQDAERITLQAGQKLSRGINLKELKPSHGQSWDTGEYLVSAQFFLCSANSEEEITIPSDRPLQFMIAL